MSKLIKKYIKLKEDDPKTLYLFKSGIFYIFLDEDAKLMSPLLNLKLTNLNSEILKCGFPINSLSKYLSKLDDTSFKIKIINSDDNNSFSNNIQLQNLFNKIINVNIDSLSVKECFEFIGSIQNETKKIIKGL